ncbi:MAG TPA: extracellular solute-binding protein [Planctomycetaceae bacterium]|nr:extracellular solute-binding protein [Planctomycetaceae bacterium]
MPVANRRWLAAVLVLVAALAAFEIGRRSVAPESPGLVVYCAHDAEFAAAVLSDFEAQTGIPVIVKYDAEATKSLGFVNQLIHEKEHPQCDVFWNNELLGTCELKEHDVLVPYRGPGFERIPERYKDSEGHWAGFAARLRVYIVNTERFGGDEAEIETRLADSPDLTRVAIAQPLFGTTLTHYTLLWHVWGKDKLIEWHDALRKRGIRDVAGNAKTKQLVAEGACDFGFTDTDDFFVAKDDGKPVAMFPVRIDGQTICIPNSVAIVRGTQQLASAQKLVDYLLSAETELKLARSQSRQVPLGHISQEQLPEDVRPLVGWSAEGADLRPLLSDRQSVVEWLKSESLR